MAPVQPRAETSSSNQPNVPLVVALSIVGAILVLTAISAGIYLRRRFRQRRNAPSGATLEQFTSSRGRSFEKYLNPHSPDIQGAVPLISGDQQRPVSGHEDSLFDPYESYHSKTLSQHISYESYNHPRYDAEGRSLLTHNQSPTQHYHTPTPSRLPSPEAETSSFMEELGRPPSLTPRDLPRLAIPSTQIRRLPTPPPSRAMDTAPATASSAVEVNLVAPGLPKPVQYSTPLPPSAGPSTSSKLVSEPHLSEIPVEVDDSDADTESLYSQFSASTRHHRAFSEDIPPPPVPPLPEHLRALQSATSALQDDDQGEEKLHRVPTKVISGLLKTRARQGGSGAPSRQLSRVSRIERSNSIMSRYGSDEGETDQEQFHLNHKRRKSRKMNMSTTTAGALSKVRELDDTTSVATLSTLPNPFDRSLVSTPQISPATTTATLPIYLDMCSNQTPPPEQHVPSYQPNLRAPESRSVLSEEVHPLRISKRGSLSSLESH
uniref:Uncharacterized protein n=1 Tax=Moniliophthora roreri TaxID=221103 RepID=A0A0W0G1U2_MONRR